MNFLAHLLLSKTDEQIMVGNFIGDFVKGSKLDSYEPKIQHGIRLHRAIDNFTDQHPIVLKSKKRLRARFRHYAPVIVDVFYDHFIAKDWETYSSETLHQFTQKFYKTMKQYASIIPQAASNMLYYMSKQDWLFNYQFLDGIDRALTGMSKRTRFDSKMETAIDALNDHYAEFQNEFNQFFPELQTFVNNFETK